MTGVRGVLRVVGLAGLLVTGGVATNQVLNDGKLSWTWMYAAFGVAVLSFLLSERAVPAPAEGTGRGSRRVYLRQLRANVRDMETVGISTQSEFVFRMRQVYVDVSVVPKVFREAAQEPYLGSVAGEERRSLESVLRKAGGNGGSRVLAVIGGPGSGKTTLARNTALRLCGHRWRPWRRRLPVLLYLRRHAEDLLADEPPTLGEAAVKAAWLDGKVSARWLDRRLDSGGCVVLLDGLDEVVDPAARGRVVDWVDRQIQRHPHNVYVVTSRPYGYRSNPLRRAEVLQVRRFTWEQIDEFLRQWSYATESRARGRTGREVRSAADHNAADLLARLQEQGALYDLAANPLLLTMTANVHRYRGELPGTRAELYAEMCDVLLHRRVEARGLSDGTGLTGPHKQHVAQHLALAMMKAEVKDWPVRDATRAISRAVRQVPGGVSPRVFLEVACNSGLLVEREHDVYGFAHLTLQEYLAAAQLGTPRADTSVLIENVEAPWWRETILLWSAANDATDIINACLDRGTVPALALAFDCADQARTVEPETRDRLEELLDPPAPDAPLDAARQHLLAGVQATRSLRDTVRLHEGTALCARPVPHSLYGLFVHEERAAGLHHPDGFDTIEDDGGAAVGMRVGDAERFVDWLNAVTGDAVYRLPTLDELSDSAAASLPCLDGHTVWAYDGAHTVLRQPPGVPWPCATTPERLPDIPTADRQSLTPYLRLLAAPVSERVRVEPWASVLGTALNRAREATSTSELAALELPLVLALSASLACAHVHARTLDNTYGPDSTAEFERLVARAVHFARDVDVMRATDVVRDLDTALASTLGEALHTARRLREEVARDLAADRDPRVYVRQPDYTVYLTHNPGMDRVLTHAFGLARDLDLGPALEAVGEVTPFLGTVPLSNRLAELSRELTPPHTHTLEQDVDPSFVHHLDLAMDLCHDLAHPARLEALRLFHNALTVLLDNWSPFLAGQPTVDEIDRILADTASRIPAHRRPLSDPAVAVRHAHDLLMSIRPSDIPNNALTEVGMLTDNIATLLASMRSRATPIDSRTLPCVRTALLVAIAVLQEALSFDGQPIPLLELAWLSLTALDVPAPRRPRPNQILLLARTQP
ncbi:NACHT domain-containing NTPase [Streptomyces sp. AC495_CC817]|uniref:NACHT domain-containing protein n=2 Tax=unclassified Streptomyces TaxID=2593676 RepID=UPI001C26EC1F|nr:NACHT domain-containing protein [Streptomyces sp. AC495_CC817]